MNIRLIFGIVGFLVIVGLFLFVITSSCVLLKNKTIFHKRKIIEVTHADGTKSYKVMINGLLGLPFLYQVDIEDFGLYEEVKRNMPLDAAKDYINRKEQEWQRLCEKRVVKCRTINN